MLIVSLLIQSKSQWGLKWRFDLNHQLVFALRDAVFWWSPNCTSALVLMHWLHSAGRVKVHILSTSAASAEFTQCPDAHPLGPGYCVFCGLHWERLNCNFFFFGGEGGDEPEFPLFPAEQSPFKQLSRPVCSPLWVVAQKTVLETVFEFLHNQQLYQDGKKSLFRAR